jgi:hypothetical protein
MNKIIMPFLVLVLMSCNSFNKQPKEFFQERSRTYQMSYDSVVKKIVEFAAFSKIPAKMFTVSPGLIFLEESFDHDQAYKYTDYNIPGYDSQIENCLERLFITIKSDSSKTKVEIESMITCSISYRRYIGKGSERFTKTIDCKSNGAREKEILDFISENLGGNISDVISKI